MGVPMKPSYEAQISAFVPEKGVYLMIRRCKFWGRASSGASHDFVRFLEHRGSILHAPPDRVQYRYLRDNWLYSTDKSERRRSMLL